MKALSIRQPYASAIADGEKWVEYRTWPTNYRGDVLICAGKQPHDDSGLSVADCRAEGLPLGQAVCVASLEKCVELDGGDFGWVLDRVRKVLKPWPVRGALGLFDVEMPKGVKLAAPLRNPDPSQLDAEEDEEDEEPDEKPRRRRGSVKTTTFVF